jgi:hypothetical protein
MARGMDSGLGRESTPISHSKYVYSHAWMSTAQLIVMIDPSAAQAAYRADDA